MHVEIHARSVFLATIFSTKAAASRPIISNTCAHVEWTQAQLCACSGFVCIHVHVCSHFRRSLHLGPPCRLASPADRFDRSAPPQTTGCNTRKGHQSPGLCATTPSCGHDKIYARWSGHKAQNMLTEGVGVGEKRAPLMLRMSVP
jgi:hypothetical protein